MDPTPEQRTYARLVGICILAKCVLEGLGDSVTIIARGGETFVEPSEGQSVSAAKRSSSRTS